LVSQRPLTIWKYAGAGAYFVGTALIGIAVLTIGFFIGTGGTDFQGEYEAFFGLMGAGIIVIGAGWMFSRLS
jgi:hypothetical protein